MALRTPTQRTKWLVTLLAPPAALLLLELALRAADFRQPPLDLPIVLWNETEDRQLRADDTLHRPDLLTLWSPRPGAAVRLGLPERINAAGYRGPLLAQEKPPGTLRVAFVGESTTFGLSVLWELTAAGRLPGLLATPARPVEVLNLAVAGQTLLQGLERWRALGPAHRPDVVAVAFGLANEHAPCLDLTDAEKLAAVREMHGGWRGIWYALSSRWRVAQLVNRLQMRPRWTALEAVAQQRAALGSGGRLAAGQPDWDGSRRVSPEEFEAALTTLTREIRRAGARPILVSLPRGGDLERLAPVLVTYSRIIEQVACREEAQLLDLRAAAPAWVATTGRPAEELFLPLDDWHLGYEGQALFAERLAALIEDPSAGR